MGGYLILVPVRWVKVMDGYNALLWLESAAVWAFAAAWLTKGRVIGSDVAVDLMAWAEDRVVQTVRPKPPPRTGE